jgi:hypothetical protein
VQGIVEGAAPRDLTLRTGPGGPSIVEGRLQGAWISVLRGSSSEVFSWRGVILPVVVVAVVATVVACARKPGREVEQALGVLLVALVAVWLQWPTSLLTGLVPAAPLLLLGVALVVRSASGRRPSRAAGVGDREPLAPDPVPGDRSLRRLLVMVALFAGAVLAKGYADGGGFQWGGRFFSPLLVPAAAVAAIGLGRLVADRPGPVRRTTTALLVGIGLVSAVVPVLALGETRSQVAPIYAEVARNGGAVNVTTSTQLPRLTWREDLDWLVAPREEVGDLLTTMHRAGITRVTAVVPVDLPDAELGPWRAFEDRGPLDRTGLRTVVLTA